MTGEALPTLYGADPWTMDEQALYGLCPIRRDEVAAVAAVDEETAQRALDLIVVDYEVLPAVMDPFTALEPEAPVLFPNRKRGNLTKRAGWSSATSTKRCRTPRWWSRETISSKAPPAPIEPHAVVAEHGLRLDGHAEHANSALCAPRPRAGSELPADQIGGFNRLGGAFGEVDPSHEMIAAKLAMMTRRSGSFSSTARRPSSRIGVVTLRMKMRLGADAEGQFIDNSNILIGGAPTASNSSHHWPIAHGADHLGTHRLTRP